MAELDLSKAVEAGARAMLEFDYPEDVELIDHPGDPMNLAGYHNSFDSGLEAALPHILDALAKKAEMSGALTHDSIAWAYLRFTTEWLRIEADGARNA